MLPSQTTLLCRGTDQLVTWTTLLTSLPPSVPTANVRRQVKRQRSAWREWVLTKYWFPSLLSTLSSWSSKSPSRLTSINLYVNHLLVPNL